MCRVRKVLVQLLCVVWIKAVVYADPDCEPALKFTAKLGEASLANQASDNASVVCRGGPCCSAVPEEHLISKGRDFLAESLHKGCSPLFRSIEDSRKSLSDQIEKLLNNSKNDCLNTFHQLFPRLYGHAKRPVRELFSSLRNALTSDETSVENALLTFWIDLFPLVYHSNVHSNLDPFSSSYMSCLKKSNAKIVPWRVVPKVIEDAMAKAFGTVRLMNTVLNTGHYVIEKGKDYQIPKECGIPTARLYLCAKCHGVKAQPCFGFCSNVARGCLSPLMEIDGAWNDLGTAATRVEQSIKLSGFVDLIRNLPTHISEAVMVAMESGIKLQKMVRKHCGPHSHEESTAWHNLTNEGLLKNGSSSLPVEDWDWNSGVLELRVSEAAAVLSRSKGLWSKVTEGVCSHLSENQKNCWNGQKVDVYSRPVVDFGVKGQKYNPEVQISKPDPSIYALANKLRDIKRLITKELNWEPESDSHRKDTDEGSGYGSDTRANFPSRQDDDDDEDNRAYEGSGMPPDIVSEGSHDTEEAPEVVESSSNSLKTPFVLSLSLFVLIRSSFVI